MPVYRHFQAFTINKPAAELHAAGLDIATSMRVEPAERNYDAAHEQFRLALRTIAADTTLDQPSADLQTGRIRRDVGFTIVRQAIVAQDARLLLTGEAELWESLDLTYGKWWRADYIPSARAVAEQWGEHHATFSLLGRTASVGLVLGVPLQHANYEFFKMSHRPLSHNRYYQTSNASTAARHERLEHRLGQTAGWVSRAGISVIAARHSDPANYAAARNTFLGRLPDIRSVPAAEQSVLDRP